MLTAALVCIPASPKIDAIKSEAPLITFGCSVKSSVELTNPVSFTQDLIFDMRNIYSPNKMKDQKIKYFSIGN